MTTDLFATNDDIVIDEKKDYLTEMVGEGKKYKTVADLAKAQYHADSYIPILTRRLDEKDQDNLRIKKEYESRAGLEELLAQLKQQQTSTTTTVIPQVSQVENKAPVLDESKLNELVSTKLTQWDQEKRQTANVNEVRKKLTETYGSHFQETLKAKAEELRVSPQFLNNLAKDHPTVLYKTLGLDDQVQPVNINAPSTSQRFVPRGEPKRTWDYYQKMKKENRELYDNPRTALQMQKDAIELGDAFQDGDYNRDFSRAFHLT